MSDTTPTDATTTSATARGTEPPRALRAPGAIALFVAIAALLLGVDLVSKRVSFEHVAGVPVSTDREPDGTLPPVPRHDAIIVVPKVLALRLTWNHGAVFGIGQGKRTVFIVFSLVAVAVIGGLFVRSRANERVLHVALAAVLAGALGNMYDRVVFGAVRDMLLLFPGVELPFGWSWPDGSRGLYPWIFNVADVCLVVGLLALLVLAWRADAPERGPDGDDDGKAAGARAGAAEETDPA